MKNCGVKGCNKEATRLYVIMENIKDRDCRIEFNVCEKHSKIDWRIDNNQIQATNKDRA